MSSDQNSNGQNDGNVYSDAKIELEREKLLIKGGWLSKIFGSGETAKTHYVGCTLLFLIITEIMAIVFNSDATHIISPLLGMAFGYFVRDRTI